MSALRIPDKYNNVWQYHSQSDRHSKIACWAIMFDLLTHCSALREHVAAGKIGFGINHELRDFRTRRKKNLDLVVCTPSSAATSKNGAPRSFVGLAQDCEILLSDSERATLASLPPLLNVPVGSVCVALEAKATMTAHLKALPRLHDELDSSHLTIHGATEHSIAAALVTVNLASTFRSTSMNKHDLAVREPVTTRHKQPNDAIRTIEKVAEIRRRSLQSEQGFDAIGIMVLDFENDGTDLRIVSSPPAPQPSEDFHYNKLVERICSLYRSKFPNL